MSVPPLLLISFSNIIIAVALLSCAWLIENTSPAASHHQQMIALVDVKTLRMHGMPKIQGTKVLHTSHGIWTFWLVWFWIALTLAKRIMVAASLVTWFCCVIYLVRTEHDPQPTLSSDLFHRFTKPFLPFVGILECKECAVCGDHSDD